MTDSTTERCSSCQFWDRLPGRRGGVCYQRVLNEDDLVRTAPSEKCPQYRREMDEELRRPVARTQESAESRETRIG